MNPLTFTGFSLEWGIKTLLIAENQLPFFPMFLALVFSLAAAKRIKFLSILKPFKTQFNE